MNISSTKTHVCAYLYWKILIDGETHRLEPDASIPDDPFDEAQDRMSKMQI